MLRIRGRPSIDEEMSALEKSYPLTESAMLMCKVGSAFEELLDDDEPMVLTDGIDDLDNDEEDDATTGAMKVDGEDDDDD
ncbi:hypothetical protein HAX54_013918 [Datura stramonium]|uniref:Uncharacterized protein n=1 Tax=Datura stramonium TaxID=4076 RepID=A0ABS8RYN2_DATST|nr:hypothetical protein [Datura stramonium]